MGEMGVSPRPTVAQWLQQKQQQRKRDMQEALICWDRSVYQSVCATIIQWNPGDLSAKNKVTRVLECVLLLIAFYNNRLLVLSNFIWEGSTCSILSH